MPVSSFRITVSDGEPADIVSCCPVIDKEAPENFSSSVLIASRLVLTASHSAPPQCFVRIPASLFFSGPVFEVVQVVRAHQPGTLTPDLALLVLAEGVPPEFAPAKLASAEHFAKARQDGVTLCGFGFTRDAFGSLTGAGIKRRSRTPVRVMDPTAALPGRPISEASEFIAGSEENGVIRDAELADSGGPAYLDRDGTIVVGIVSRNAPGHRSVFTRVDAHLDWIRGVAKAHEIPLPPLPALGVSAP